MLINLSELFTQDGKEKIYQEEFTITKFSGLGQVLSVIKKNPVTLHVVNTGDRNLLLKATTDITLEIPCGRCLESVALDFELEMEHLLHIDLTSEEKMDDSDEQPFLNGYDLDVDQLVCYELLLNLPMKVLCDENCKGICNRCGTNLNHETCDCHKGSLDPRMAAVQEIFKQFKEV